MNTKLLFISMIALTSSLLANSSTESTSLSSSSADYNGNTLILKGNVVLDHGLGKMIAEQAFLEKQESGRDFPFSFIRLQHDVRVMTDHAELKCDAADFDFISLKGTLLPKAQEKVTYVENDHELRLISDHIQLDIEKQGFDGKKTAYHLDKIHATGDVIVDYAKAFTLRAGSALYEHANKKGILTAYPANEETPCHLNNEGNEVLATKVQVDLAESRLSLQSPSGRLLSSLVPHIRNAEILFKANQLIWDHLKNTLSLKGNVDIKEASIGTIQSDGVVQIVQTKTQGKHLLKSIRSQGKTTLTYVDSITKLPHQFITYGPLHLDREHLRVAIESPRQNGQVLEEKQISYSENNLTVFADKGLLEYALVDGELQPVSVLLKGNVRLASSESNEHSLCGLSDRILFSPSTKTLILAADPNKRVLFWDEEQGLRISSQEIHITEDPSTRKKAVKGVGNVKFAFSNEENTLLHKTFPTFKVSNNE
jgi:lipopolysaccharide export system protein LptA